MPCWLLALCVLGQDGPAEGPVVLTAPEVITQQAPPIDEPLWEVQGTTTPDPPWLVGFHRIVGDSGYFRADWLYWRQGSGSFHGPVFGQRSVTVTVQNQQPVVTTSLVTFNTAQPNPTWEMGTRFLWGRYLTERLAVEAGGFWVHPIEYHNLYVGGTVNNSSIGGGVSTTTVTPFLIDPNIRTLSRVEFSLWTEKWGAETNARFTLFNGTRGRLDLISGWRYLGYKETFTDAIVPTAGATFLERFQGSSNLLAPQIGFEFEVPVVEYVSFRLFSKGGVGPNFQEVVITGPTTGGALTGVNNQVDSYRVSSGSFAEIGFAAVCHLTANLNAYFGGNFLYLSNVARAMDQFDLAGAAVADPYFSRPNVTQVWIAGIVGGLELRY